MKNVVTICACLIMLNFISCKKESSNVENKSISQNAMNDEVEKSYDKTTGNTRMVFKPGNNGEDSWVKKIERHPLYADSNYGSIEIIKALVWQQSGFKIYARSFIKFKALSNIPATANIVSAKLMLYGLTTPNSHMPMGDSYYPGTKYPQNDVWLRRVTSAWNEGTVTWNSQPGVTTLNQQPIPYSTSQYNYDVTVDVTKLVAPMVADPAQNFGFSIRLQTEQTLRAMGFYSSESTLSNKRPKLVLVYN